MFVEMLAPLSFNHHHPGTFRKQSSARLAASNSAWLFRSNLRSIFSILPLPNEDFGRMNKRCNPDFRSTFQGREYSIWATNHRKVSRKSGFHLLFILPKSSFGEHRFAVESSRRQLVPFFSTISPIGASISTKVSTTTLKCLSKCSPQWGRLSKKRGLVADGW
jgi:hypothetical protein